MAQRHHRTRQARFARLVEPMGRGVQEGGVFLGGCEQAARLRRRHMLREGMRALVEDSLWAAKGGEQPPCSRAAHAF